MESGDFLIPAADFRPIDYLLLIDGLDLLERQAVYGIVFIDDKNKGLSSYCGHLQLAAGIGRSLALLSRGRAECGVQAFGIEGVR